MILDAIKQLHTSKARGYDDLPLDFYVTFAPVFAEIFYYLINYIINLNYIPSAADIRYLYPIPKPGKDHHTTAGYRDVYNMCLLMKIFDMVISRYILLNLHDHHYQFQNHAYLKNHNQQQCLLSMLHDINILANSQLQFRKTHVMALINIDISSAFTSTLRRGTFQCA